MEVPVVAPARCELRSVIKFLHAKKIPPTEIHRQLEEVYGEKYMDVKNVRKFREFSTGRLSVHDEECSGRKSQSDETVRKVEELVLEDRRLTLNETKIE
jgi:NCAIR mutase (PurE)-related protein